MVRFGGLVRGLRLSVSQYAWAVALLLLLPLSDQGHINPQAAYDHARKLFLRGYLAMSQQEAEVAYWRLRNSDAAWALRFQLLEAEAISWRGMSEEALTVLSRPSAFASPEMRVEKLTLEGVAHTHLNQLPSANQELAEAEGICVGAAYLACGSVPRARGVLAIQRGDLPAARRFFNTSLRFSRERHDGWLEATSLLNLGTAALLDEHYDEAIDWSHAAEQRASELDAGDILLFTLGNLGWAYYGLGDGDRALDMFKQAEERAVAVEDSGAAILWLTDSGRVYQDENNLELAAKCYRTALDLARQVDSEEDILNALEDLARVSVRAKQFNDASRYVDEATPLMQGNENRLDAMDIMLAQGEIAAARREDAKAEDFFAMVERDPASQTSTRLGAQHELAKLYELQGHVAQAEGMYKASLGTFEDARAELEKESSKLPFLANAAGIYDDYIHFLVSQGKTEEALLAADQSRARTLAQGLKEAEGAHAAGPAMQPRAVARKAGATLLFYWLGEKQSYLWAVTPDKIALFTLPSQGEIAPRIQRYRKALLGIQDPLDAGNSDGRELYKILVAPAAELLRPNAPVMILADGALSQLNFETLIVPESPQPAKSSAAPHYWLEDATVMAAPSLAMLAAARPAQRNSQKLLLLGDTISPGDDYPELRWAALEMSKIESHFTAPDEVIFARQQATPAAYLGSNPRQFAYIHFVSHGFASSTDPLDSAIILSRPNATEDSFKLYAREIMQHPIDARLVTISACNTSGTRSYAGEGLVGLSWAFLRAGAHNAIGALWEASDESTPRLMDRLYRGLQQGESPGEALRAAKLTLLHSNSRFRSPFYWAPFQLYTRM
jgi:CHAT domain-containing protein